jgi:hypothetical protein
MMRFSLRHILPALALFAALPAQARQSPAGAPPSGQAQAVGSGAEELVGLFGATCLHFAGDPAGVRGFLTQQGVPAMPAQARAAFLAGRAGQVFDASEPGVNLAVVSLDDGGCEAVVEKANPAELTAALQKAARDAGTPLTDLGSQADSAPGGVHHEAYSLNENGKQMHILVSTASAAPQAVLTLAPR